MRRKLAVLLALCMTVGMNGIPAGIQEVQAAEVQGTERTTDVEAKDEQGTVLAETEGNESVSGDFEYAEVANGTRAITKYNGNAAEIVVPSEIDGKKVSRIEAEAFLGCESLVSVTIPSCVVNIGTSGSEYAVFSGCSSLKEINIEDGCAWYSSQNGILCNEDGTKLLCCPAGKTGSVEIPDGVTEIGRSAFANCDKLVSITIPNSVTAGIGVTDTFGNVTSYSEDIFAGCNSLEEIIVDSENIEYCSVDGMLYLKAKKGENQFIGGNWVQGEGKLTLLFCPAGKKIRAQIPENVWRIAPGVFYNANKLTDIIVDENNTCFSSLDGILYDAAQTTLLSCPVGKTENVHLAESVTQIGAGGFYNCTGIKEMNIPESVTGIGEGAFANCSSLESITIPKGVTTIGTNAFANCSELTAVTLPDAITSIYQGAFSGCSSLESITIPKNVNNVGDGRFGAAFVGCSSMKAVYVEEANRTYVSRDGMVFNYDMTALLCCPNGRMGSVVIPEGVVSIEGGAFEGCSKMVSLTIPKSMEYICGKEYSSSLPFTGCDTLEEIIVNDGNKWYYSLNGILYYEDGSEYGTIICYPPGKKERVITLEEVFGIASGAFNNCNNLQELNINSCSIVYKYAFSDCSSLQEVIISGRGRIIEGNAFSNCSSLENVTLLDLSHDMWIDASAFANCNKLHIYCEKNSAGQEYAVANNIPYTLIERKEQTITASDITKTITDGSFTIGATTDGNGELTYESSNESIVTIAPDGMVTVKGVGTAQITISASETAEWKAAQKVVIITVNPKQPEETQKPEDTQKPDNTQKPEESQKPDDTQKPEDSEQRKDKQTITAPDLVKTVSDPAFFLGAETNGDGTLSFYSHQPDVITVDDSGMAEIVSAGTAQISVRASATEFWEAAETTVTVTVIPEDYTPIYDIADLYAIRNNPEGNYILVSDIDMSETRKGGDYDCGTGWDSIETFSGTLDGNGHKIIGMQIFGEFNVVDYGSVGVGLFEKISGATIKNLGVVECNIEVAFNMSRDSHTWTEVLGVGCISGIGNSGNVENCYSKGNVTISKINHHNVQNNKYGIGGLVGYANTDVKNCVNLCRVDCTQVDKECMVGGICGICGESAAVLQYCYSAGNIAGNEKSELGGICGEAGIYIQCKNCSYLKDSSTQGVGNRQDNSDCVSLTEAQMRNPKLFTGFDFTDVWETDAYCSYPYPQLKNNRIVRVNSIKLASAPRKLVYAQGEALNTSGGILEIIYEDDIKTSIPLTVEMVSGYDMEHIGEQTVWVQYGSSYASFEIEVKDVPVSSVTLPENISLYRGREQQLEAAVLPVNASNPSLQWNSDNPAVATVDGNGLVKAKAGGTATITASSVNGIQAKCVVSVIVPSVSIQLSPTTLILKEGVSAALTVTILPLESTDTVQWTSSNPAVADVYDGTVIARKAGTAVITASTGSGVTADCTVTVQRTAAPVPGDSENWGEDLIPQTITAKDIKKTYGAKPFSLNAKASGGGQLTYTAENKKVAIVDKNGKVTIKGYGVTEIEIHAAANGKYREAEKTITLTVAPKKLTLTSAKPQASKSITVKWKRDTKASGYIIECSTDKKFRKGVKTVNIAKNKTVSKKIPKLKAGKKYYIRACAYTLADGERIKGAYSKVKTVKVKK